jgi:hypothetical protein
MLIILATGIWILIVAFYMWRFEAGLPVSGDGPEPSAADASGATAG